VDELTEHDRKITTLEGTVQTHGEEIHTLRDDRHAHANLIASVQGTLRKLEQASTESTARFEKHMEREEEAFEKLYQRLKSMDDELKASFEKRDERINTLDKTQVKLLTYATTAFLIITTLANIIFK